MDPFKVTVDFANSKETDKFASMGMVPEGWHRVYVSGAQLKTVDNPTQISHYINIEFSFDDYNQKCWHNFFVNGRDNNDALFTLLKTLGCNVPNATANLTPQTFLNKKLMIEIAHKPYKKDGEDKTMLALKNIKPLDKTQKAPDEFI